MIRLTHTDRLFLSELIRGLPWIAGVLILTVWFGFLARHGETFIQSLERSL